MASDMGSLSSAPPMGLFSICPIYWDGVAFRHVLNTDICLTTAKSRETCGTTRRIGGAIPWAYFSLMSRPLSATAQRDPIRALFLCLIVMAQLLMPSAFAQALAAQADG